MIVKMVVMSFIPIKKHKWDYHDTIVISTITLCNKKKCLSVLQAAWVKPLTWAIILDDRLELGCRAPEGDVGSVRLRGLGAEDGPVGAPGNADELAPVGEGNC